MPDNHHLSATDRYKQLVNVLQETGAILNTNLLQMKIVDSAAVLCDADASWILIPDVKKENLLLEKGCFNHQALNQGISIPLDKSIEGWVYLHQMPIMINDMQHYDNTYGDMVNLPDVAINSILSVPLRVKNKTVGVLEVVNQQPVDFSQLDKEILLAFADQAAIYIENTYRFHRLDVLTELIHELHTPLASLNTALYLLQRTDLPDSKREHISHMIQTEFNRLTNLTTSYLDYARFESGRAKFKPSLFDLALLLRESVDIMQMQAGNKAIKLNLGVPEQSLLITADKDKIEQVIINLINNAMKYSPHGGEIHITTKSSPTEISFSVTDNGQGIPPEYLPHLFERFFRVPTHEKSARGTGLGLTICRQIVEGHQGKIEVESTIGSGSTFTVHLPLKCEFMPHQVAPAL